MNARTPIIAGLALTIGVVSGCGASNGSSTAIDAGGDDDVVETTVLETLPSIDPPSTDPATIDPPTIDPPAKDPPASGLPDWASGAMVTVQSDTGPLELPVELAPFCESSRSFYIPANGLGLVRDEQVGTLRQLFASLAALVPATIETAPSEEFAVEPTAASDQLTVIIAAFEEIGYDTSRIAELSDPESMLGAIQEFTDIRSSLRSFLVQACGADDELLDEQSADAVAEAAEAAGEVVD